MQKQQHKFSLQKGTCSLFIISQPLRFILRATGERRNWSTFTAFCWLFFSPDRRHSLNWSLCRWPCRFQIMIKISASFSFFFIMTTLPAVGSTAAVVWQQRSCLCNDENLWRFLSSVTRSSSSSASLHVSLIQWLQIKTQSLGVNRQCWSKHFLSLQFIYQGILSMWQGRVNKLEPGSKSILMNFALWVFFPLHRLFRVCLLPNISSELTPVWCPLMHVAARLH